MTLTPSSLRLDLKCGRGAISEGETCHVGPASKVDPVQSTPRTTSPRKGAPELDTLVGAALLAGAAGLTAAAAVQLKNARSAVEEKFGRSDRYEKFDGAVGDLNTITKQFNATGRPSDISAFGDVVFGKVGNKDVVIKKVGDKISLFGDPWDAMVTQGIMTRETANGVRNAQKHLTKIEVEAAQKAGELGFGPRVLAAKDNTIALEVATGRPLIKRDTLIRYAQRFGVKVPGGGIISPDKQFGVMMRMMRSGDYMKPNDKAKVLGNLARMHTAGIAHNDLHPGNIFVSKDKAQFIDFGLAETGGAAVASEFVRMMNPPRFGLEARGGFGYNLKTLAPQEYNQAADRIKKLIGKNGGALTSADIRKAVDAQNNPKLEAELQKVVDDFYSSVYKLKRTDSEDARIDKKCGASAIPDNRRCTKATNNIVPVKPPEAGKQPSLTKTLLTGTGVAAVGATLGILAKDIFTTGVPADKVPPQTPPEGLYDSFKPGDLIYQVNDFLGAKRAHYAVYVGKVNGEHRVFDASLESGKSGNSKPRIASRLSLRSIEEATDTGTSYARAERVDKDRRPPTMAELDRIVTRLNGKSFDWNGFEYNCETLARHIVNDTPVSTQTEKVSALTKTVTNHLINALAPKGYRKTAMKQRNIGTVVSRALRSDQKCGASGIPDGAKCTKGGSWPRAATIATAIGAAGLTAGALGYYAHQRRSRSRGVTVPQPKLLPPGPDAGSLPKLPGITPRALLKAAPPRQSRTQRMRSNSAAAMRSAEAAIGQTAREEVRRIAQIGNTMALTGEAAGMAAKTTLRELRLRAEAARRRYEPGYRSGARFNPPAQLPEGGSAFAVPFTPSTPGIPAARDPRTGQPRRARARGFGRQDLGMLTPRSLAF